MTQRERDIKAIWDMLNRVEPFEESLRKLMRDEWIYGEGKEPPDPEWAEDDEEEP